MIEDLTPTPYCQKWQPFFFFKKNNISPKSSYTKNPKIQRCHCLQLAVGGVNSSISG